MAQNGLIALGREAGGEGHRMLLGDADVEHALGKGRLQPVEAGALRHGGGDGDDLLVAPRGFEQRVGEDLGVGGRVGLWLGLRAGDDVEGRDAVIFVVRRLGRRIALALLGHDMDQHRARRACRARSSGPAADGRDCGRRSGRHSRSRAPRTACRRSRSRGRIPRCARPCRRGTSADGGRAAWRRRAASGRCGWRRGGRDRPTSRRSAARSTCRCR